MADGGLSLGIGAMAQVAMVLRTTLVFAGLAGTMTGSPAQEGADPGPFASFDRASPSELNDPHDLAFGQDFGVVQCKK